MVTKLSMKETICRRDLFRFTIQSSVCHDRKAWQSNSVDIMWLGVPRVARDNVSPRTYFLQVVPTLRGFATSHKGTGFQNMSLVEMFHI